MVVKVIYIVTYTIMLISFPVTISQKYSYYLFENFEMTKACFVEEQGIIKELQISRRKLHRIIDELGFRIHTNHESSDAPGYNTQKNYDPNSRNRLSFILRILYNEYHLNKISISTYFHSLYHKVKHNFDFSFDFEKVYKRTAIEIWDGALKGLIMLQETYEQDIKDFSKG